MVLGTTVTFSVKSEPEEAVKSVGALGDGLVVVGSGTQELI